jgi:hypothetical protein
MLFSCDFTVELREDLWRDIININPIDFSVYMDSLTSLEFIVWHKIPTGQWWKYDFFEMLCFSCEQNMQIVS